MKKRDKMMQNFVDKDPEYSDLDNKTEKQLDDKDSKQPGPRERVTFYLTPEQQENVRLLMFAMKCKQIEVMDQALELLFDQHRDTLAKLQNII